MADEPDAIRPPWSRSERSIPRVVVRPLQEFLATSTSSALVLLVAIAVALLWANLGTSYERFWTTSLVVRLGETTLGGDLRFWVNDGLMTVFFLLVGMELKRELVSGQLRDTRAAALPAIAAVGGMLVPALLFLLLAGSEEARHGWGIVLATEIAFTLGVLALSAHRVPAGLRPMLLTLAIVDDTLTIVVIAVWYSHGIEALPLVLAAAVIGAMFLLQRAHVRATIVFVLAGAMVWYLTYRAGIHPTLAGVTLGLLTPSHPFQPPAAVSAEAKRTADRTSDDPDPPDLDTAKWLELAWLSREAVSPIARIEHALLPWSSFVVVPVFALANAGVPLSWAALVSVFTSGLGLAIVVARVVGKPLGIVGAARAAVAARAGALPGDVAWGDVAGMGAAAGIGFTVALFVAELAFPDGSAALADAKVAILVASVLAGAIGTFALRRGRGRRPAPPGGANSP